VLTTDQKGAIAELAIARNALEFDVGVYRAVSDAERYDLIFDWRDRLVRVRCKWASLRGDVLIVRCYRARRNREGLVQTRYTADEIDAFPAYCAELNTCYFLPIERFPERRSILLRFARRATTNASDFTGQASSSSRLHWALLGP
jgi:hypothetical protein